MRQMHANSSNFLFPCLRLPFNLSETPPYQTSGLEEQHRLDVLHRAFIAFRMSAPAACGIRCLTGDCAQTTIPDRIHVWMSLWKAGGEIHVVVGRQHILCVWGVLS